MLRPRGSLPSDININYRIIDQPSSIQASVVFGLHNEIHGDPFKKSEASRISRSVGLGHFNAIPSPGNFAFLSYSGYPQFSG